MTSIFEIKHNIRNLLKRAHASKIKITEEMLAHLENKMGKEAFLIFQEVRKEAS